jgi:predicted ribosome quality control (RQC) complex YloA/Tae2 family protein
MLQNYFFLNRFILDSKSILENSIIKGIFSQEKSKLLIELSSNDTNYFLELCVIPGNSYLNVRKNYSRAKKNTINFFEEAVGDKINSIEIADDDRIIKLKLAESDIFFTIRGKFTNVIFSDSEKLLHPFKSTESEILSNIRREITEKRFLNSWNQLQLQTFHHQNFLEVIRKNFPILGNEVIKEVKARSGDDSEDELRKILLNVLDEIKSSQPCVFINEFEQETLIGFENFISIPFTEKKVFTDVLEALNYLLSKRYYLQDKFSKEKLIRNHIERELKKVTSKIQNLQGVIERGTKEEEFNKNGKLLLANLSSIKSRMSSIVVEDIFSDGEKVNIKLNPALSPQKNIEYYFEKSRSEKIAFLKSQELFENAKKDFDRLKYMESILDKIESKKELDDIMKQLKIKISQESNDKEDLSSKFKHYIIENKYDLYVGKDSKNNDLLTTKFAKQNDYWFHSRGSSGSHVILRIHNSKESVPKSVLKKAASIAAYHSKAKTAGIVPVVYTFKKYVVKKKGDPAGTVHLLREDVLLVKPEIPASCEYVSSQD